MAEIYPAGTESIRNLTPTFIYFLVVKGDPLSAGIPQKEYFVYRYKVKKLFFISRRFYHNRMQRD